jgi:transcription termination factor NusA
VVGQLLASEGFKSVEELVMVDEKELAGIEGFDEDTARELQARAKEFLDKEESDLDAKRVELGVEDALKDVPGVTTKMLVHMGEDGIKTVEDWPAAHRRLVGWTERKDGEAEARAGLPRRLRSLPRGGRGADHAGARQSRLDQRGPRRRPRRAEAAPKPGNGVGPHAAMRRTNNRGSMPAAQGRPRRASARSEGSASAMT